MRVLFAGTPEVALPVLRALMDHEEHDVVGVLTRADARRGRGRALHPSPVAALARGAGLDVRTPTTLKDEDTQAWVRGLDADVAVVVAYGRLVPPGLLDVPAHGWLNLHFSLLPAWRGAAPVQRAVMAGDRVTGASVFRLEAGLDTGPVYAARTEPVGARDTAGDLLDRLAADGAPLVLDVLDALARGTAVATAQAEQGVSLAPTLSPADGEVDWRRPAEEIDRQVRGVTPAPGARTTYLGLPLRLGPLVPAADGAAPLAPGELHVTKRDVLVGTGTTALRLGRVAPAGKSWMEAEAWARGARPAPGTRLGAADDGQVR
ncbi:MULTISPECIES: methionyl-tRNA formyltransferase [unclassified Actinomyces]|uniref:methionyl-tRNA formyltransferase n=3 Tax=Actinomyces TaxID=1654 RepID=UPI002016F353|nr:MULTISPECIES: methionyl-tRNA formyltransferase [unclassified Actinomyces]MCL3778165.1 methionyl-tRNA formyltransferase [Actinomyces sp. AC-20-1]MCL3789195.1 methionyl-tRNA formyltransferase [Actinomyces sp. 187325]MCL3791382.1 methionyl-tRNA formyltransferase [Actinomyces sp. 186855]MCL3793593.1 methionyl-tRNA formyltransferase [Actinomyces sp. 217892]